MRQMKKRVSIWMSILMIFSMMLMSREVKAATTTDAYKAIVTGDLQGRLTVHTAVALSISGTQVFYSVDSYNGEDCTYELCNPYTGETIPASIRYQENIGRLEIYVAQGLPNDVGAPLEMPIVGQEYTVAGMNHEMEIVSAKIRVDRVSGNENSVGCFDMECTMLESIDDLMTPAPIVDSRGNCIGLVLEGSQGTGEFHAFISPGTSGGGQQDDYYESEESDRDGSGRSDSFSDTPSRGEAKDANKENDTKNMIIIGVGAATVVLLLVVFMTKKKKTQIAPPKPPTPPVNPEYAGAVIQDYAPTQPLREETDRLSAGDGWESIPKQAQDVKIFLEVISGPLIGHSYQVKNQPVLVGRSDEAVVCYPTDTKGVSRKHCKVFFEGGALSIMDIGSSAGTYLQGKGQIPKNTSVPISEGDIIYLGSKNIALRVRIR